MGKFTDWLWHDLLHVNCSGGGEVKSRRVVMSGSLDSNVILLVNHLLFALMFVSKFTVMFGVVDKESGVAYGTYEDSMNTTG